MTLPSRAAVEAAQREMTADIGTGRALITGPIRPDVVSVERALAAAYAVDFPTGAQQAGEGPTVVSPSAGADAAARSRSTTVASSAAPALGAESPHYFGPDGKGSASGTNIPSVRGEISEEPEDEAGHTLADHIGALEALAASGHGKTARLVADAALRLYASILRESRRGEGRWVSEWATS